MTGGLLVDTGFFFALLDRRDQYHATAETKKDLLDTSPRVILPWPVLYETLNTRFVGLVGAIDRFERLLQLPATELLDDSKYRDDCYRSVLAHARRGHCLSLVDTVLRSVIEDTCHHRPRLRAVRFDNSVSIHEYFSSPTDFEAHSSTT